MNAKSWIKRNKLNILLFIVILGTLELLINPDSRGLGMLLLQAFGFISLFGIGVLIIDYNHKNPHKISAFFKHHTLALWFISGLLYITMMPFITGIYALVPDSYHKLIILVNIALVSAYAVYFGLAMLLASYLLRHFRSIYYPKGRRI